MFGEPLPAVDASGRPISRRRGPVPIKGQRKLRLPVEQSAAVQAAPKEPRQAKPWQELVLNEGTPDEIRMVGRYYTIAPDAAHGIDVWNEPPETRGAAPLARRIRGYRVFVLKDSEISQDPRRNGWADAVVLEITPEGERPKVRRFFKMGQPIGLTKVWLNDLRARRPTA